LLLFLHRQQISICVRICQCAKLKCNPHHRLSAAVDCTWYSLVHEVPDSTVIVNGQRAMMLLGIIILAHPLTPRKPPPGRRHNIDRFPERSLGPTPNFCLSSAVNPPALTSFAMLISSLIAQGSPRPANAFHQVSSSLITSRDQHSNPTGLVVLKKQTKHTHATIREKDDFCNY